MTLNDRNPIFADNSETKRLRIQHLLQVGVETTGLLSEFPEELEVV